MSTDTLTYEYDVVVIGAGGAGLRAAIEARAQGRSVAIICKSLFGKAHTVMAEGGAAAAMGNVNANDNWQVHFRDTMRGGKFLNNPRMAELHAKEAPDRVWELEEWGALFDRTKDGKISQRNFGGHEYPRLAHVGDRTGLELIRTLQQAVVSFQQKDFREHGDYEARIKVFAEHTITRLLLDGDRIAGAFGYRREDGQFVLFKAPAVVLATGGIGKSYKVTSNSWEYTGDGHALALLAGATLINMECIQFHPTGMVWPPSVKGILVTESVRGDGGVLRNSEGKRFMFGYVPDVFRKQYAETEEEADRWYTDPDHNRRPPELLPRDEVARSINSEVKAGRGTPHGGVFLDIASRLPAEEVRRRLPSMYHQFKELADVDITAEPMEVGPTCHYVMGGVEVDPDTAASSVLGLFAAGEVAGGMHGSNRLGGNSLSDLLVFGRRAGLGAADYIARLEQDRPEVQDADVDAARTEALAPLEFEAGENPYTVHSELQQTMNDLVGIIRREHEVAAAIEKLGEFRERREKLSAPGSRTFNPGWHLALDLRNMLLVSDCVAKAALERQESRGGHTREDYPVMSATWRKVNLVCSLDEQGRAKLEHKPVPTIRHDLLELFEVSELRKYMTEEELAGLPGMEPADEAVEVAAVEDEVVEAEAEAVEAEAAEVETVEAEAAEAEEPEAEAVEAEEAAEAEAEEPEESEAQSEAESEDAPEAEVSETAEIPAQAEADATESVADVSAADGEEGAK
ncbi:fumarate reductase/succinate dehydrogenase flavoprotein subunit [Actinospica durhamensis]|uniref:Fumarate reductase/succinate dehydrogenase flavoprotein subunit n=1 Tax=Actinospica durhamensis TaxID=1508375 RepID=A0A941ET49_9ACTN|nr:fumarate reductase/succinate dehydrogenase flavoprotein subunit [Actinospica durhamensis]MBR7835972.1 fumarate reductase/succinate dehydrogenase flavoprotein subunit [Actinospica durhamensis]